MKPYAKSLKPNSQMLRSSQTEAEKRLWYRVRNDHLGFRFYRQKPLLSYIVDFYCPKAKLVIELDIMSLNIRRMTKFEMRNWHR